MVNCFSLRVPGQFGELKGALNAAGYPKCKKKGSCVSI
jgi:hypothetical protein